MMGSGRLGGSMSLGGELGTVEVVCSKTTRQTREDGRAYVEYTFDISIDPELALGPVWRFTARYSSALETHRKLERVAGGRKGGGDGFVLPTFPPKYRGTDMVNKEENVKRRGDELREYYTQLFNVPEVMSHPMLSTNMGGLCAARLLRAAELQTPENIAPILMLAEENNRMIEARRNRLQQGIETLRDTRRFRSAKPDGGHDDTDDGEPSVIKSGLLTMSDQKYYFELGTRTLRFFADEPPASASGGGPRPPHPGPPSGEIPFVGAAVIQVDDETTTGRHCFDIETQETAGRGKMKVRLDAASRDDLTEWYVAVLEQQMLLATGAGGGGSGDGGSGHDGAAGGSMGSGSGTSAERVASDPPWQRGSRSDSMATEDSDAATAASPRLSITSGLSTSTGVSVPSEMPATSVSMKRLWERENEYSLTAEAERLRTERRDLLHWVLREAERVHHERYMIELKRSGPGRVLLPRGTGATNTLSMPNPKEFDLGDPTIVPNVLRTLERSQALEEEMQIDLQDAARATVFDPDEFPATTVPELRPAFTEQQLTVAAFETLLCCTLVVPPEDQTARKLLETAYKGGHLKKEIYQQQLAALKRSEQSAAMGMSQDVGMDEYDDASVSADSLDSSSNSYETGAEEMGVGVGAQAQQVTQTAKRAIKTTIREQCDISTDDYKELFHALSVHENDSDKDGTPHSALEVGVASPSGGFRPPPLYPAQHVLWRWRCLRQRRPVDFRNFEGYRAWATRQVAMVVCGLLSHIQDHVDHCWSEPQKCEPKSGLAKLQAIYRSGSATDDTHGAHRSGSSAGGSAGPAWAKQHSSRMNSARHAEKDIPELRTDDVAYKLVQAARKLLHLLDYELEFDGSFFDKALGEMSLIMYIITQEELGELKQSFLPLNCVMYDMLLDCAVFRPRVPRRADDYEDEQERRELEAFAMQELIQNRGEVINALRFTWRPLRLSDCYHQVLMATSAFKNFERDPKENMLWLLLDAIRTITELKQSDASMTMSMQEQEKLAETLSTVRAFAEQRLLDVTNFYNMDQKNVVRLLCGVYAEILKASGDDVRGKLDETVESSVRKNFDRHVQQAEFQCDEMTDKQQQKIEQLTRLSTELDLEMEAGVWRKLIGSLKEPDLMVEQEPEPEPEMLPPDDDMDFGWEECEDDAEDFDPWQQVGHGMRGSDDGLSDDDFSDEDTVATEGIVAPSKCWHPFMSPKDHDKWLLSGVFDVYQPYTDQWDERFFILTTEELLVYAESEEESLVLRETRLRATLGNMAGTDVNLLKRRRCTIQLTDVESMECEGTEVTLSHEDGEQTYQINLPRRGGLDKQFVALVEDRLRRIHGDGDEDGADSTGGHEGDDAEWVDPVHHGLMILQELVKLEARAVLANADVDANMISCMKALQQLDAQMVTCYTRSPTGKHEAERGKSPPDSILDLGELTEQAVRPWIEEKSTTFQEWKQTSLANETWEPAERLPSEDGAFAAASVIDMFQMLGKAVRAFEESGMKSATSAVLQAQFTAGICATIEDYVAQAGICGTAPVLPAPTAPPRGTKQDKSGLPPKRARQPTRFTEDVERNLQINTLRKLTTKLNTLGYAQQRIDEDFTVIFLEGDDDGEDLGPDHQKGKAMLARVHARLDSSVRTVRAFIAAKIVHGLAGHGVFDEDDSIGAPENEGRRGALLDGLYTRIPGGKYPNHLRRLGDAMQMSGVDVDNIPLNLDHVLEKVINEICDSQRYEILLDVLRAFVKTVEFVLLNDDPYRIFTEKDSQIFNKDLEELKNYFSAGLDPDQVRHECQPVEHVLHWCDLSSEMLAGPDDSMWQLLANAKEESELRKKAHIAMVISHRRDGVSATFLRKFAEERRGPKGDGKGKHGKTGGLLLTMGTVREMAAQSDAQSMKKRSKHWPPTIKDLEKLQYKGPDGWSAIGVIRRDSRLQSDGSGVSRWPNKWFVLWPTPDAVKSDRDYPAKELKQHGGRWLFQFECTNTQILPVTAAEATIPIAGVGLNAVPDGDDMFVVELTPKGQAEKIRLKAESMEASQQWMSAIATLADC